MIVFVTYLDGSGISFRALNIRIEERSIHRYTIDWKLLETRGFGVEVWIDQQGDGVFEIEFWSDEELNTCELEWEKVNIPPVLRFYDFYGLWHTSDSPIRE